MPCIGHTVLQYIGFQGVMGSHRGRGQCRLSCSSQRFGVHNSLNLVENDKTAKKNWWKTAERKILFRKIENF